MMNRSKGNRSLVQGFIDISIRREIQMMRRMDRYYAALAVRISDSYINFGENGAISALTNSNEALEDIIFTSNSNTAGQMGNLQIETLRKSDRTQIRTKQFNLQIESQLEGFLTAEALNSTSLILETDKKQAAKIIADGINTGLGEREIARNLNQSFGGQFGKVSAARIARTETGIAGSMGQDQGAREEQAKDKLWVAVSDARTRAHHNEVDNERRGIDEFFHPGGEAMLYPHDTKNGASPGNFINCRCAMLYD